MLAAVGAGAFDNDEGNDKETRASSSANSDTGTGTKVSVEDAMKSSGKESRNGVNSVLLLRRLQRAAKAMVRERLRVEPHAGRKARYDHVSMYDDYLFTLSI